MSDEPNKDPSGAKKESYNEYLKRKSGDGDEYGRAQKRQAAGLTACGVVFLAVGAYMAVAAESTTLRVVGGIVAALALGWILLFARDSDPRNYGA